LTGVGGFSRLACRMASPCSIASFDCRRPLPSRTDGSVRLCDGAVLGRALLRAGSLLGEDDKVGVGIAVEEATEASASARASALALGAVLGRMSVSATSLSALASSVPRRGGFAPDTVWLTLLSAESAGFNLVPATDVVFETGDAIAGREFATDLSFACTEPRRCPVSR